MDNEPKQQREANAALIDAIAHLYAAFARYPLRAKIPGCPHCELDAAERSLHSRPLREMTWNELGVFPFKAMTTFGDEEDFKHFLPRILELHAREPLGATYDVDVTFGKLDYASWERWPASERDAIRRFVDDWIRKLKADGNSGESSWILEDLRASLRRLDASATDARP